MVKFEDIRGGGRCARRRRGFRVFLTRFGILRIDRCHLNCAALRDSARCGASGCRTFIAFEQQCRERIFLFGDFGFGWRRGGDLYGDGEFQWSDFQMILVPKFDFSFDRVAVDESAVGRIKIFDEHFSAANENGTVFFADRGASRAELTLRIPTNYELIDGNWDFLPGVDPLGDHKLHFHVPLLRCDVADNRPAGRSKRQQCRFLIII